MPNVTLAIARKEAEELQAILDGPELGDSEDVIHTYTAWFEGGFEVDIKVCNGDKPYVDAVLFLDGCEVNVAEVSDTILGEYDFRYEGETYVVNVELA